MYRALIFTCLMACAGAQTKTTIASPQDFETTVTQLIDQVVATFKDGGINCNMISGELRSMKGSQKFEAAAAWRRDHPESNETFKKLIAARKDELQAAMAPTDRQCGGPAIAGLVQELTQ